MREGQTEGSSTARKRNPSTRTPKDTNLDTKPNPTTAIADDEPPRLETKPEPVKRVLRPTMFPKSLGRACYSVDFVRPLNVRIADRGTVRNEVINGIRLAPGSHFSKGGKGIGSSRLAAEMRYLGGDLHVHFWAGDGTGKLTEVWAVVPSSNTNGMMFEGPPTEE